MPLFSPRHAHLLQAFFTSLLMSLIMSGVITFLNLGWVAEFLLRWLIAWLTAFAVAFPAILLVIPVARRI
jgi:hypothetical protein